MAMNKQEIHSKIPIGLKPSQERIKLKCSCSACDSIACFAKRQLSKNCICNECGNSRNNIFIDKNSKYHHTLNDYEQKVSKELLKNEVTYNDYETDRDRKTIDRPSRVSYEYKTDWQDNLDEMVAEMETNISDDAISVTDTGSRKKVTSASAKLSAQIMNLPYKEFEESISCHRTEPLLTIPRLSPFNIFQKIKEVYKACSCKVCDCIVGKPERSEFCTCKPCNCDDCNSFKNNILTSMKAQLISEPEGCYRVQRDKQLKSTCKARMTSQSGEKCDCVPCECIKCMNSVSMPCCCKPCQCIDCNNMAHNRPRTLVVAAVGDEYQPRQACQCTPCECIQCGHSLATSTPERHEMSTGLNRHPQCRCETCLDDACLPDGNQTCRCERRNRVMRKPVLRDTNDYDIRAALIQQNLGQFKKARERDTITMFAAVTNEYPSYNTARKKCACNQCECLECSYKENTAVKSNFATGIFPKLINSLNNCKCSKCECEFCSNHIYKNLPNSQTIIKNNISCKCDECNCLNCEKMVNSVDFTNKTTTGNFSDKAMCKCRPCECTECESLMHKSIDNLNLNEVIYPVKKGALLTPEILESKLNGSVVEFYGYNYDSSEKINGTTRLNSDLSATACDTIMRSQAEYILCDGYHYSDFTIGPSNHKQQYYQRLNTRSETIKRGQPVQYTNISHAHFVKKSPPKSDNSSIYSKMDSGSISPVSRHGKSWENSCNSSGHDYSNYLVQFPKTTVETCLDDIIKLDGDINPDKLSVSYLNSMRKPKISPTLYNCEKYVPVKARPIIQYRKNEKVSYDECSSIDSKSLSSEQASISNQCSFINSKENTNGILDTTQTENRYNRRKYSDRSRSEESHSEFNKDYSHYNRKPRKSGPSSIKDDFLLDEDYERVQKTIEDAREFSQHLTTLFEKYEKANREFVSVSQKLKDSINQSNIYVTYAFDDCGSSNTDNVVKTEYKENESVDIVPTKENALDVEDNAGSIKNVIEYNINETNKTDDAVNTEFKEDITKKCENSKESNVGDDLQCGSHCKNYPKPIFEQKEPCQIESPIKRRLRKNNRYNRMYKRALIVPRRTLYVPKIIRTSTTSTENSKYLINQVGIDKYFNNKLNESSDNRQTIAGGEKDKRTPFVRENYNQADAIIEKVNSEPKKEVELPKPHKEQNVLDNIVIMIKPPADNKYPKVAEESQPWHILKKNYCIESDRQTIVKGICMQPLEIDVKNTLRSITWDSDTVQETYTYNHHKNRALVHLQSEVKKLLDLPILKKFDEKIESETHHYTTTEIKDTNMECVKEQTITTQTKDVHICNFNKKPKRETEDVPKEAGNTLDDMKVTSLVVRRVSDHTVMVRWNVPRVLKNVTGYELTIDGRPVQKIFNAAHSMAVVTCLPNVDQMLLTVRTVTNCQNLGRSPATTTIYRPRERGHVSGLDIFRSRSKSVHSSTSTV